jgi:hypothetical protein
MGTAMVYPALIAMVGDVAAPECERVRSPFIVSGAISAMSLARFSLARLQTFSAWSGQSE